MKLADAKSNTHTNYAKETNNKDPKFKITNHVSISKNKNIFVKCYVPN